MPWQPSVNTPFQTPTAPAREYLRMPEPAMVQIEMWKDKSSGDIFQQQGAVCWRTLSNLILEPLTMTQPPRELHVVTESSPETSSLCHGPAVGIEFQAAREEAGGEAVLTAWVDHFKGK